MKMAPPRLTVAVLVPPATPTLSETKNAPFTNGSATGLLGSSSPQPQPAPHPTTTTPLNLAVSIFVAPAASTYGILNEPVTTPVERLSEIVAPAALPFSAEIVFSPTETFTPSTAVGVPTASVPQRPSMSKYSVGVVVSYPISQASARLFVAT